MDQMRFREILDLQREQSGVEFKQSGGQSDPQFFARVVRAALSMANRRDGGIIVLGVEETAGQLNAVGMAVEDLSSWSHDNTADGLATYADPSISFELSAHESNGARFVVIEIYEFSDVPVICKKDFSGVLRAGACYVRSRRKPESVELPGQTEMRDLLELALEKRLRHFVRTADRANVNISADVADAAQRFAVQLGALDE